MGRRRPAQSEAGLERSAGAVRGVEAGETSGRLRGVSLDEKLSRLTLLNKASVLKQPSRIACDHDIGLNVAHNHRAHPHKRSVSDREALPYRRRRPDVRRYPYGHPAEQDRARRDNGMA